LIQRSVRGLDLHHPPCESLTANRMFYAIAALAYKLDESGANYSACRRMPELDGADTAQMDGAAAGAVVAPRAALGARVRWRSAGWTGGAPWESALAQAGRRRSRRNG